MSQWAAFSELAHLYDAGCVLIRRPPPNARRHAALDLKTLIRHKGHVEPHGKMGLIYRGHGMLDMMHALTARDYGAENFCTRDRQFAALAGDPGFKAINFVVFWAQRGAVPIARGSAQNSCPWALPLIDRGRAAAWRHCDGA